MREQNAIDNDVWDLTAKYSSAFRANWFLNPEGGVSLKVVRYGKKTKD